MSHHAFIAVTTQPVPYHADTTAIFNTLCNHPNTLLLDSAEIGSKNSLQSLILINAAVKISCLGHNVTFKALNANGKQVLKEIQPILTALAQSKVSESAVNFDAELQIEILNEQNALPSLMTAITASESGIQNIWTEELESNLLLVILQISVKDTKHLANVVHRIKGITGVVNVKRNINE